MTGRLKDITRGLSGEWVISITTQANPVSMFYRLKDFDVDVEIKKATKHRSLDANAFMWSLCTEIAKAIRTTKEEVYKKAIREVGEYEPLPIKAEAVETFMARWAAKGTGWFAEVIDDSKLQGYKLVFAYYGSSTYDTASMSRVIDYLMDEMKQMELPIPASKEQEEMLKAWRA